MIEGDPDNSGDYFIMNLNIDSAVIYGRAGSYVGVVAGKAVAYTVREITASDLKINGAEGAVIGMVAGQANTGFSCSNCRMNAIDSGNYADIGEDNTDIPIEVTDASLFYDADTEKVTLKVEVYNNSDYPIDVLYAWFRVKQNGLSCGPEETSGYLEAAGKGSCELTFELTGDAIDYNETAALYMNGVLIRDDLHVTPVNL